MTDETQHQEAETPETPQEDTQEPQGDVDYKAEAAKWKAIAERNKKKLEKVSTSIKDEEEKPKETPNTQAGLSRDEALLIAKGYEIEEVDLAAKIAKLNGISMAEATKDEYFQATVKQRKEKERSEKAELPAAQGPISSPKKSPGEMTQAEHREWYMKEIERISKG